MEPRLQGELSAAQAEWVYSGLNTVTLVPLLGASLLVAVTWGEVDRRLAATWLAALGLVAAGRLVLRRCFFRKPVPPAAIRAWLRRYTVGSLLNGVVWGLASLMLYVSGSLAYQMLLAFMVGGLGAGAAATQHPYPAAFRAWLYPATLPIVARVLAEGDSVHFAMGCMGVAYALAMDLVVLRGYRSFVTTFQLRFENRELIERLTRAQTALQQSNQELEQRVDQRTAALLAAQAEKAHVEEELRHAQKLEALGQLTGGVAHDFNNWLTVIVSALGLVARRVSHDPEVAGLIETANSAADRGSRLTQSLLAFSRKQMLSPTVIDLRSELSDHGVSLIQSAVGQRVRMDICLPESLWSVHADIDQLQAALLNLCVNARDAMPAGGELRIEAKNVVLETDQATLRAGEYVRLSVRDNGRGMSAVVRERVFEPFFTTKEVGQGSGLGLSMVYGFARQSKGDVEVDSKPGRGTTISLWLPRHEGDGKRETRAGSELEPSRGDGQRILFVEDEQTLRNVVERVLVGLGYEVVAVADAKAALLALKQGQPFELLFSDVIMPGKLTGLALARVAQERQPCLKVLLASGYTAFPETLDDQEDMPYPLLVKPYRPVDLAEALHKLFAPPEREVG